MKENYKVPVGISNKHVHLSQADLETLFGKGHQLTHKKDLLQPGQYAAEEQIEVVGSKGSFKVRVLGPVRKHTQVELSFTDARSIGVKAPIRDSGNLEGTPGVKIVGPKGEVEIDCGVIAAKRHIHLSAQDAEEAGVKNGDLVKVAITEGERRMIMDDVLIRVNPNYIKEFHVDTDEGNAACLSNDQLVEIIKE